MYSLVAYKIAYPSFQVQQIATPASGSSNNPLYNTTTLQTIPVVELPAGGKYTFQFSTKTFLELTLDTFTVQQTSVYPTQINQDSYYQQSYNTLQPLSTTSAQTGFKVTRQTTETLYLEGDSFTIDTTNLSDSQIVTVSLPTYIPLQVGLTANNPAYNVDVSLIYPTTSFYTNTNVISPQNWNITSPFGIQYTVGVLSAPGVMYTVGFDVPDLYGNTPTFTINGENLSNSVFNGTPTIDQDYVPELPSSQFSNVNPMQMTLDGSYNYGNFSSLGYADGLYASYPVFFKEQLQYAVGVNSNNQYVYAILLALSLYGGKNGIRFYGLLLGSQPLTGYTVNLMENPFLVPAQSTSVSATLQSNAKILPTLISSSTSSVSVSTVSSSSSTSSSAVTSTTQTTTTTTTTTTNVSKTSISLTNLFTSPLAVLILILALIGVVLFVTM
jgi:hypothetical protein